MVHTHARRSPRWCCHCTENTTLFEIGKNISCLQTWKKIRNLPILCFLIEGCKWQRARLTRNLWNSYWTGYLTVWVPRLDLYYDRFSDTNCSIQALKPPFLLIFWLLLRKTFTLYACLVSTILFNIFMAFFASDPSIELTAPERPHIDFLFFNSFFSSLMIKETISEQVYTTEKNNIDLTITSVEYLFLT